MVDLRMKLSLWGVMIVRGRDGGWGKAKRQEREGGKQEEGGGRGRKEVRWGMGLGLKARGIGP